MVTGMINSNLFFPIKKNITAVQLHIILEVKTVKIETTW
jgi:hypothetical protein